MWRRRPVPRTALTVAVGLLAAGIALVVGALGLGGRRVSSTWLLLSAGLGCFAVADSVYLVRVANGTYEYGTADLGWLAGIGALLYVMTVLDPTNARATKQLPTHRAARSRADT